MILRTCVGVAHKVYVCNVGFPVGSWYLVWRRRGRGRERGRKQKAPAPCGHRQSEFRELALTGRYCRVHLASVQFGRGYEPIDSPYSTQYGPWRARSPPESGQLLLRVMDRAESSTLMRNSYEPHLTYRYVFNRIYPHPSERANIDISRTMTSESGFIDYFLHEEKCTPMVNADIKGGVKFSA